MIPANDLMSEMHNEKRRISAVLREDAHAAWLSGSPEEVLQALKPYPSEGMEAWQVSGRLYANKTLDDKRSERMYLSNLM